MAIAIRAYTKKKRAPEPGTMIGVRLQGDQLAQLDALAQELPGAKTRPEIVRRLIELGIAAYRRSDAKPDSPEFHRADSAQHGAYLQLHRLKNSA